MSKRTEHILESDIFIAFVTKNYLKDARNKDREITEQISIAKEFDKPTFLIYLNLSKREIKEADELFKEHKVIKTLSTTRKYFDQKSHLFLKEMRDWCDQNLAKESGTLHNMERNLKINLNPFESAYLLTFIYRTKNDRDTNILKNVIEQLQQIGWKIKEEAGVKVEKLPNGYVKLTDKDGNIVIRKPYEWEKKIFSNLGNERGVA